MVAVACKKGSGRPAEYKVYTFDLPSRTRLGPLLVPDGELVRPIWTHDECLRFATIRRGSITIWEVEFTLKHPPTKVEFFPIPDEVDSGYNFLFLPVFYRLAFTLYKQIQVRDVKASKLLLDSEQGPDVFSEYSFSSDGRFFAFSAVGREFCISKESPAGYALHQQPPFTLDVGERPILSPNGRSIVFPRDRTINLWHTDDQTPSPPKGYGLDRHFLLALSPDEKSAAFAKPGGNMVGILDLRSGDLRLVINTGMRVQCLGVPGDTVVVVDKEKIVTWNLPGGDHAFNATINDSVRTVMLDRSSYRLGNRFTQTPLSLSLSHDLSRIAVAGGGITQEKVNLGIKQEKVNLGIHDVTTGTCLASTRSDLFVSPSFTRDGREIWSASRDSGGCCGWEIIEGGASGAMELKPLEETLYPSRAFLSHSIRGYQVTDDGWVLSPTRKRLLWLPHSWREDQKYRLWSGQFLGLTHRLLSEVVILEFLE